MKKLVSLMLCVFMLIGMMSVPAFADAEYEIIEKRQAISNYLAGASPAELVIPAAVDGVDIITILDSSFTKNEALEKLVLPEGLLVISDKNFNKAPLLNSITLPETLQIIGESVFNNCNSLTEISLPPRVSLIGSGALNNNEALAKVTFTGVAPLFVGSNVFKKCSPDLVIYVPDDQLEEYIAVLPQDLDLNIQPSGQNAVYYDFTTPESNFAFDAATGTVTAYTGKSPRVEIPETIGGVAVTAIGDKALEQNVYTYCVVLPYGLTAIGKNAFDAMTYNDYVYVPDTVTSIAYRGFAGYQGNGFRFPNQLETMGEKAFASAVINAHVELPVGLTELPVSAFESSRFTGITIPASVTTIGEKALYKCKYYTELTIPASVTSVGSMAFAESDRLETVIIECKADIIPADAFDKCKKIKKIIVPADTASAVVDALAAGGATVELSDKPYTPVDPSTIVRPEPVPPVVFVPAEGTDAPTEPTTPAVPAGDVEAYFGVWTCTMLDMDGIVMTPSDLGMTLILTVNADGTATLGDGIENEAADWKQVEGGIEIDGSVFSLTEDDKLVASEEGIAMHFERGEGASVPAAPVDSNTVAGTAEDFVGVWNCTLMEMDGISINPSTLGITMVLTINADGTAVLADDEGPAETTWMLTVEGTAEIEGMIFALTDDGKLCMSEDGASMYFEKGEGASAPAAPVDSNTVAGAAEDFVGVWNCTLMEAEGMSIDPVMLGIKLELILSADGTAVLTDDEGPAETVWTLTAEGAVDLDGMILSLTTEGKLVANMDDTVIYFTKGEGTSVPAAPVDVDLSVYVGQWNDGQGTIFTVNEDGTCVATDEYGDSNMNWEVVDGIPTVTTGFWMGATMIPKEDGTMYISDGWVVDAIFSRGEGTAAPVGGTDAPAADVEAFLGDWVGMFGDKLTINADGTLKLVYPDGEVRDMTWEVMNGVFTVTSGNWWGAEVTVNAEGVLNVDGNPMNNYTRDNGAAAPSVEEVVAVEGTVEDFAGLWFGAHMVAEGMTMNLSDFGMTMEITMNTDGKITLFDGEAVEEGEWKVVDGKADIDGMLLTLMSDGTLVGDMDGAQIVFVGYAGVWTNVYMDMGDGGINTKELNIVGTLTLNADGSGSMDFPEEMTGNWYKAEDGNMYFGAYEDYLPISLHSGGFLMLGDELSGYMIYSRNPDAIWTPVAEAPVAPTATEAPAVDDGVLSMEERLNRKFVAKTYTVYGNTRDAAELGSEWSLFFREDGSVDFAMAGMMIPELKWGSQKISMGLNEVDAFVINYSGLTFNAVLTDDGFEMDYYGTMTLHFAPAE